MPPPETVSASSFEHRADELVRHSATYFDARERLGTLIQAMRAGEISGQGQAMVAEMTLTKMKLATALADHVIGLLQSEGVNLNV